MLKSARAAHSSTPEDTETTNGVTPMRADGLLPAYPGRISGLTLTSAATKTPEVKAALRAPSELRQPTEKPGSLTKLLMSRQLQQQPQNSLRIKKIRDLRC